MTLKTCLNKEEQKELKQITETVKAWYTKCKIKFKKRRTIHLIFQAQQTDASCVYTAGQFRTYQHNNSDHIDTISHDTTKSQWNLFFVQYLENNSTLNQFAT